MVIYRILREALTNIMSHSLATKVKVGLKQSVDEIMLVIEDNGRGISKKAIDDPNSIGLCGMKERAESCKGHLDIDAGAGIGTRIIASLPLTDKEDTSD
jgi:two-component system sensor histidine kinase UhpB